MYKLDVVALLQMLQEFQQNATLQTEIQSVPGAKGRFQVHLYLFQGKVASSFIIDSNGKTVLFGDSALQWLRRQGTLNWTLTLQQTATLYPVQNAPSLPASSAPHVFIPRRIAQVTQEQMSQWPRKYRTVFVLIDGRKSAEQIAGLLSLSTSEVERVLYDLQLNKFVEIE